MNQIFLFLLFIIIFFNILINDNVMKKRVQAIKINDKLKYYKKNLRKLQLTKKESEKDTKEDAYNISSNETVSSTIKQTSNSGAALQIKQIFNYERTPTQLSFKIYLYFLRKYIVEIVFIRLKLIYKTSLRNLQSQIEAESVPTNCIIRDEYKNRIGNIGIRENIGYDCTALTSSNSEITNISLDTDYPLNLENEAITFDQINFDKDAVNDSDNIINSPFFNKSGSLDEAQIELPIHFDHFLIKGKLNPENLLSKGDLIPLQFIEFNKNQKNLKKIYCTVTRVNGTNCTLRCDTMNQPIKTTTNNFNLAKSINSNIFLTFNFKQEDTIVETPFPKNFINTNYSNDFFIGVFIGIIIVCIIIIIASSIEQNKFEIIILIIMGVLLLITFIKEWVVFASCGAVERCLIKNKLLQYFLKFSMSLLVTILAFIAAKRALYKRDGILLRIGFIFSMFADFSFSIIKAFFPDSFLNTVLGISSFMIYQLIMIFKHSRQNDGDNHFPKIYIAPAVFVVVFIILCAVGIFSVVIGLVAIYASIVICSLIISVRVPCKNYYPPKNAKFIRWGMVLFTIGDLMVGVAMFSGEDHSAIMTIAAVANNLVWILYLPGQVLLIWGSVEEIIVK